MFLAATEHFSSGNSVHRNKLVELTSETLGQFTPARVRKVRHTEPLRNSVAGRLNARISLPRKGDKKRANLDVHSYLNNSKDTFRSPCGGNDYLPKQNLLPRSDGNV